MCGWSRRPAARAGIGKGSAGFEVRDPGPLAPNLEPPGRRKHPVADEIELVTTVDQLEAVIDHMAAAPRYSLDVESDGFHSYAGRVCIVTLSSEARNVVVDTLALGPETARLARLVGLTGKACLLHSGHNDVLALKREFDFNFGLIHDTSVASMLLGFTHTGLSALCQTFLGFPLAKELQRHDWSRRPILPEHVDYLVNDTKHLFSLTDLILQRVREHELIDEYEIECRAVAQSTPVERDFDPERFRRIRGALELDDAGRGVLRALYIWRNQAAKVLDRAAFRVVSDGTLLDIARLKPTDTAALAGLRGVGDWLVNQAAQDMLAAVQQGIAQPAPFRAPHRAHPQDNGQRMSPRQRDRLGRLKKWREREAAARGVGLQAVLPTAVLHELVLQPPENAEALAAVERVGASRAKRYGEQVLKIVRGKP
jgi:ribonuclease D